MSDLNVEEFDFHPSFNDTAWPALIGDQPLWKKASTWCIIFGVLIAFLLGAIVTLLNGNNQQMELLDKLEKNVQKTINSAFENKQNVIANEIEGIITTAIDDKTEDHFSKRAIRLQKAAIIVGMATVLILTLTSVKLWGKFKIALRRNTSQPSEGKMGDEPEANKDVSDNGGQQLLMVDELPEERGVREEEQEEPMEQNLYNHTDDGKCKEQQAAPRAARAARAAPFVAQAAAVEPAGLVVEEAEGGAEGVALAAQAAVVEPVGLGGEEAEGGAAGVAPFVAQAAVVKPAVRGAPDGTAGNGEEEPAPDKAVEAERGVAHKKARNRTRAEISAAKKLKKEEPHL